MELRKKMKSCLHVLLPGLCICAIVCSVTQAADWPNYRGPNYDGISTETGFSTSWPVSGPKVLWKASIGTGFASMAVSNGKVYAMGNIDDTDYVYCFDAASGKEIWKKSYPCPIYAKMHEGGPCATPTVEGDAVYILSKDGDAIRYKAATGDVVWHKKLNKDLGMKHPTWHFSGSPLIVGDIVIYNVGTYGIALNKNDGSTVWQNGKNACGYSTGVPYSIGGQKGIAMAMCKELVGLNPTTGKVLWKFPWKTSYDINAADAVICGDKIFVSSGYGKGCALLEIDGGNVTEIWQNKNMKNQINCSVLKEGHLYGFDGQLGSKGKLACLDVATGEQKWSQGGLGTGSLVLADGKLIILGEKGKLAIAEASPEGYKELASAQILSGKCWTSPVLSNGRIYARNAAGQLVCVDVSG